MATGIGNLLYTMPPVSPFDVITSQAENERIANIESLADGTGIGDGAITSDKIDWGTLADRISEDENGWTVIDLGAFCFWSKSQTFSGGGSLASGVNRAIGGFSMNPVGLATTLATQRTLRMSGNSPFFNQVWEYNDIYIRNISGNSSTPGTVTAEVLIIGTKE